MVEGILGRRTQLEEAVMNIADILKHAKSGTCEACEHCPWSPRLDSPVAFGLSCREHGLDWSGWEAGRRANSMLIGQDPGGSTPKETGRLCTVCNAENITDKTAQHGLDLWEAAVSLNIRAPEAGGYLKKHYWTNAIMHGSSTGDKTSRQEAKRHCSKVLEAQIRALKPRIIIAKGECAMDSLFDIRLISKKWSGIRQRFDTGAYCEPNSNWLDNDDEVIRVYCTYQTAAGVVNRTLGSKYEARSEQIEASIERKASELESHSSIELFLKQYNQPDNTNHQGMRYLLNHWIDIGIGIRAAYKQSADR